MRGARQLGSVAILCATGLLVLAGCGGAGGVEPEGASTLGPLSNEAICDQSMADFDMVGPPPMGPDIMSQACANIPNRRITSVEFATQGNKICAEAHVKRDRVGEPRSAEEVLALAQVAHEELAQFRALRALHPPEDVAAGADRVVALLAEVDELARSASQAAAAGETASVAALLARIETVHPELAAAATQLGLSGCAR